MPLSTEKLQKVYEDLGILPDYRGCIMLRTDAIKVSDVIDADDLYYGDPVENKYAHGAASESMPHVTLLCGLMQSGNEVKKHVDTLLEDVDLPDVEIAGVDYFGSEEDENEYYCIIAKLVVTPQLLEANANLRKLPHIDLFPNYNPHISLAYVKKETTLLSDYVRVLNARLVGYRVKTTALNYGS